MACPRCSHRLLGLLTESAGRFNGSLPSHSRPSLHSSLRQTRSKAFSTQPALTKSLVLRLPNMKQFDNSDSSSGDAAAPTITNSEADAEIHRAAKAVAESADPDTAKLRDELGLDSLRTSAPQKKPERQPRKLTKGRYEGKGKTPEEKQERRQEREQYFADRRERAKGSKNMGGKGAELGAQDRSKAHKDKEGWQVQKEALKEKFGSESWQPRKKLSPDTMDGIRNLHRSDPDRYTTPVLAEEFKISPEAIRRILKSKWQPSEEETEARRVRWEKRGEKIWNKQAEMGVKPPKKWREMGVGSVKGGKDFKPAWKKQGSSRGNNNNRNQRDQAGHANDPGPDWGSEDFWSDRIF